MIAGFGYGWVGSILTITDSSDTLLFSSAGPEEYFLSAKFCYTPGETYTFEVSQIQGWWFNYYSWVAPTVINWDFARGLVANNGDESVTTFVGPAARLDVSCVSLWKHSLLSERFTRALLLKLIHTHTYASTRTLTHPLAHTQHAHMCGPQTHSLTNAHARTHTYAP